MNDCGNKSPRSLRSESGVFLLDREGVAQVFSASEENPMLKEYHGPCRKVINSFVVPHGVKGIGGRILNEIWVREKFELPDGLVHIGRGSSAFGPRAFTKCSLPTVVIPASVEELGPYAFANCQIQRLRLPLLNHCSYERQFKGASIGVLELPADLQNAARFDDECLSICGDPPGESWQDPGFGCMHSLFCNAERIGGLEFY